MKYAIEDVTTLEQTPTKMKELLNRITIDILKLNMTPYTEDNIPNTTGVIASQILYKYLENSFSDTDKFIKILKNYGIKENILSTKKSNYKISSNPLTAGSIKSLSQFNIETTAILNTLIQGGRTYNEQWRECYKTNVADIDCVSCYASALADFSYPIGIPTVYKLADINHAITLKEFLNKYKNKLVKNLYTITISGKLTFSQTLLYSKIIDHKKLKSRIQKIISEQEDVNKNTTSSDFVILENELKNTIITSDLLETLEKVCSNKELKEIYDCKVITAVYYSQDDFIESKEEWLSLIDKDMTTKEKEKQPLYYVDNNQNITIDNRSRKWCKIQLDGLINPLIKERQHLKKLIKEEIDPEIRMAYESLQKMIKNISNTFYGIIASSYFEVGNIVLANNITAKARNSIWLYSRALNGIQTITDGFQYQPDFIFQLKNTQNIFRKPGLMELSNLYTLKKNRYIRLISLNNINWDEAYKNHNPEINNLDIYAKNHIEEFLKVYGLEPAYKTEHKVEHTSYKMFYIK